MLCVRNLKQRPEAGGLLFLNKAQASLESTPSPGNELPFEMSLFDSLQPRAEVLLSAEEYFECTVSPPYPEAPHLLTQLTTDQKYSRKKKTCVCPEYVQAFLWPFYLKQYIIAAIDVAFSLY